MLAIMLPLLAYIQAYGAEITVCGGADPACAFTSLRAAITASSAGDVILLGAGRWSEPLYIDHSLRIAGLDGATPTLDGALGVADPTVQQVIDVWGPGTTLELENINVSSVVGRALRAENAEVVLTGGVYATGGVVEYGGVLLVVGGKLTVDGAALARGWASIDGGILYADGAEVVIANTQVEGGRAGKAGGGLAIAGGGSLSLLFADVIGNRAGTYGGGVYVASTSRADLANADFVDNVAGSGGGGLACLGCELEAEAGEFRSNSSLFGGGGYVNGNSGQGYRAQVRNVFFVGNTADNGGGGLRVGGNGDLQLSASNFCFNQAAAIGGGLLIRSDADGALTQSLFVGNASSSGAAAAIGSDVIAFTQNTVAWNTVARTEHAIALNAGSVLLNNNLFFHEVGAAVELGERADELVDVRYNAFWATGALVQSTGAAPPVNHHPILMDPRLTDATPTCDPFRFEHGARSGLRDTGDPTVFDPDGTRSDVGIFGGPMDMAYEEEFFDYDGDGSPMVYDCDDGDVYVYDGAVESWYDGVDQDCDGRSDFDADMDGYDAAAYGGDDCNDADERVHPGAYDLARDGVDQDCDGADQRDADHDGFPASHTRGELSPLVDCDDSRADVYPGALELPDDVDHNCDGSPGLPIPLQVVGCQAAPRSASWWGLIALLSASRSRRRARR